MYLYSFSGSKEEVKQLIESEERDTDLIDKVDLTEIAYWRKCNYLHKFFCTFGEEVEADIYYFIPRALLNEFLEKASIVLEAKKEEVSSKLLPTQSGFFFGETEYDFYYYDQIERDINTVNEILALYPDEEFLYYAWW